MKILYDHQIFTSQKYGGVSRYFYELIHFFNQKDCLESSTSILFSNNHYIANKNDVKYMRFFPHKEFKGKQRIILEINKINSIIKIKRSNYDIFHPTNYDPYFLDYINDKPFVVTVYDMVHEKFINMFEYNNKTTENKKLLCEKATKIIAISHNTKKDLIELFGIEEDKIEVIHLANSIILDSIIKLDIKIPESYILFVGTREKYKNFVRFIKAISLLLHEQEELSVLCVGGGAFSEYEKNLFQKLNIDDKVFQLNLEDKYLAHIYSNASVFVFPSLYEGFGIPVLESFACECPLVCSNASSLPEIARNGAEYFDPYSEESIYNAVKIVLNSDEKKEILVQNGTQRLKCFSWEETAKQTKKVYESVI